MPQLAGRAGVTQAAISNYERGTREPNVTGAMSLARALLVTLDELLSQVGELYETDVGRQLGTPDPVD